MSYQFVDIHTHSASAVNHPTVRNLTFAEAQPIFNSDEKGYFSVGFHPWYVNTFTSETFSNLEKWATDERFVAIGECGLDKNSEFSLQDQMTVFEKQVLLAKHVNKPLIIHCVGCFNELLTLKNKQNSKQLWIIHGFRGKPQLAAQLLNAGCALSYCEKFNADSVRVTPIERLFVETDDSAMPIENTYLSISFIKNCEPHQLSAGQSFLFSSKS